jgi:transcriptional regulator with XRE-family HTH domain
MTIQSSLKQGRLRAGLSLTDAAKRSNIQRSNIAAIENGRRDPTASTIEKIANASHVRLIPVKNDGRTTVAEASTALAEAVGQRNVRRVCSCRSPTTSPPPTLPTDSFSPSSRQRT